MNHIIGYKRLVSVLALLLSVSAGVFAQGFFQIRGTVTDMGGTPMVGATVYIDGTERGTATDIDGKYMLEVEDGDVVTVSLIGYLTQTLEIKGKVRTVYDVMLSEDSEMLAETVVIGYSTIQKKDLTGSIETISGEDIVKSMNVNATESLNGRISGVHVNKTSNKPGADMSVLIRGKNSFNYSNEPLYVIDGVPSSSGLRHINSEDILSLDILKDAASCAIYGSRGANGVIIVTTKGGAGKKDGFQIEYNGSVGYKTPTRMPDMLGSKGNGMEYVDFRIRQWTTKFGASSLSTPSFLTENERRHVKYGEYYDWLREFAHDGLTNNHTVSASGGNDRISYSFGVGYMDDGGLAGSENFKRYTANVGLEYNMQDKVMMGMSTYLSQNIINHGSPDALLNAYYITPIVGRFEPDGTPTFTHRPDGRVNPFVQDENTRNISDGWSVNMMTHLTYRPIKDLKLKTQLAAQYDGAVNGYWTGRYSQYGQGIKDPYASRSEGINKNIVWDNTVEYDKTFAGSHKLNVLGLFSMQKEIHSASGMTGEGLPYDSDWHAIHTAQEITNVTSSYWEASMMSFMGRVNYVYKDRYLVTAAARYDGTSRLSSKNRWGLLPSVAVGWSIHNEPFMKDVSWLDQLKIRASWGKTGNNSIGHNITRTVIGMNPYSFGDQPVKGFGLGDILGNEDLKWEMTAEYNLGIDYGFLGNRIKGSLELYSRTTSDLIFARQIADVNGFSSVMQNIGTTQNRGIEFSINSVNISNKDFQWSTNVVFSLNRNKIIDLDGTRTDDLANRWFIGQPMNVYYDVEQEGIWQEWEKEEASRFGAAPGWPKILDYTPDGVTDANDYHILGVCSPDWTAGITNTFNYRNWDLSVYMYTEVGGVYNDQFTFYFLGLNNQDWNKLNVPYWTPENQNNKYPGVGLDCLWTQVLSKVSGTFFKIQNITLGYTFAESLMQKAGLKGVRLYASVQNPFTFSSYLGSDPQTIGENLSTQLSLYPLTYTFGVNFKF